MCIGIPFCLVAVDEFTALGCDHQHQPRTLRIGLLNEPPTVGDWVLAHNDTALYGLSAEEAAQIHAALHAVTLAMTGASVDHLFSDLVGREPTLPPHLQTIPR